VRSKASTVEGYLAGLPSDRRQAIGTVRKLILENLPKGYVESVNWGMLSYEVPLSVYPDTYNGQPLGYAALASQKNHMAIYLCNVYAIPALRTQVEAGFKAAGKKLDMGKSCIRFRALEDLPLDVIAKAVAATPMKAFVAFVKSVARKT
jgi:hypothetical protein